jgi:hypothetical protein
MEKITKLYRFEGYNDYKLWLQEFDIIKETPCGYWVEMWCEKNKWISKITTKRYAYSTKEEALIGFIKRKEKYIWHLERKMKQTKITLAIARKTDLSIKLLTFDGGF